MILLRPVNIITQKLHIVLINGSTFLYLDSTRVVLNNLQ